MTDIFWRFFVISLLAFGGGQAVLPLVEHASVQDTAWVTAQDFSTGLAFSYITPGPVLMIATFIGARAFGIGGALAATIGVFGAPWFLATSAAHLLRRYVRHPLLQAFSRGAGPAVVALLAVTALAIAKESFVSWPFVAIAVVAFPLARWRALHPFFILAGGAVAGVLATTF